MEKEKVRLDKWLWAVRIYKTRALATDACKRGHIIVNGTQAKPSREIKTGDSVTVRKLPVIYSYQVKALTGHRVSAKLVENFLEDVTSIEELDKLNIKETIFVQRDRGAGRPTKKERRQIDRLKDNL